MTFYRQRPLFKSQPKRKQAEAIVGNIAGCRPATFMELVGGVSVRATTPA